MVEANRLRMWQAKLGLFWWHSSIMFVVSRIGDVLNMVVGLFLVPLYVPDDQMGAVLPLLSLGVFFSVPLSAAAQTVSRYVTEFRVAGDSGRIRAILRDLMLLATVVSIAGLSIMLGGHSFFETRLQFEGRVIPLLVGGWITISCWQPVFSLANQGLGQYYRITSSVLISAVSRVMLALVLLRLWGLEGYLAVHLLSGLIVCLFLGFGFREHFKPSVVAISNRTLLKEVGRYFIPMLVMTGIFGFQAVMEPWIIRHRLPVEESAAYYLASRFGMIPSYMAGALMCFLFPMAAEQHDRGESTQRMRFQAMGAMMGAGVLITLLLAAFGPRLLGSFAPWRPYLPYSSLLWKTALIAVGSGLISLYALHETACRRFGFLWIVSPVIVIEIGGLYSLMGWSFFQNYLPAELWAGINGWIRRDIGFAIDVMLAVRGMILAGVIVLLAGDGLCKRHVLDSQVPEDTHPPRGA